MNKHTALRVLAVVALICAAIGTVTTRAEAKTVGSNCSYQGMINGYAQVGKSYEVEFGLFFHEWTCVKDGQRIVITNANTRRETEVLQDWVTTEMYFNKAKVGSIWCKGKGDSSYLIYAQYRITGHTPTKAEIASYNRWKDKYADAHSCLAS